MSSSALKMGMGCLVALSSLVCLTGCEETAMAQTPPQSAPTVEKQPTTQERLIDAYVAAKEEIKEAAKGIVGTIGEMQNASLEEHIQDLLDGIERAPENYSLHVKLCDALVKRIDQLIATNQGAMQMNLVDKRDRIVKILHELSVGMQERSELTLRKAAAATDSIRGAYESLAASEQRFGRGYQSQSDSFAKIEVAANAKELTANIEYLTHVRESLIIIRPALDGILTDVATLQDLQEMSLKLDEIQMAIERFSRAVNEGFLIRKKENESTT